jgi:N-acylneuraminate cytidylyltransferase
MKAVIVGKSTELRIKNKNYRPFYGEMSMMDILIEKLTAVLPGGDIYLSCENKQYQSVADRWGINFVLRDERYTSTKINNVDVVRNICKDIPGNDAVLWAACIEPLFNEYAEIVNAWQTLDGSEYDSLNVLYPMKKFLLDERHNPIGFGFGFWHKYSQTIPPTYQISWSTAIMSRRCIERVSFQVGENPYWYDTYAPIIDIDTEDDFKLAQAVYKLYREGQI